MDTMLDLAASREAMEASGSAWSRVVAADLDPAALVGGEADDGSKVSWPVSIPLAQALHHGTDHRSQICTALTALGVDLRRSTSGTSPSRTAASSSSLPPAEEPARPSQPDGCFQSSETRHSLRRIAAYSSPGCAAPPVASRIACERAARAGRPRLRVTSPRNRHSSPPTWRSTTNPGVGCCLRSLIPVPPVVGRCAILTVAALGGRGVRSMAGRETPTNDRIVALLQDVLREVKALAVRQKAIETNLAKLAKPAR
jgi:hypothetical protein